MDLVLCHLPRCVNVILRMQAHLSHDKEALTPALAHNSKFTVLHCTTVLCNLAVSFLPAASEFKGVLNNVRENTFVLETRNPKDSLKQIVTSSIDCVIFPQ